MSFFDSRWVACPEHVEDSGGGGLAPGFRAGAAAAAIKTPGVLDVGLLVCDSPDAVSAARFTRSGVLAAPVLVTRDHARVDALRVVVANSGNANAATGGPGMAVALAMQQAAAAATGVDAEQVAVASTGVIGVALDADVVGTGIAQAAQTLRADADADADFGAAIMTTDAFEKRASLLVHLPSGGVRLSAQAKGAGMIEPAFATMLCFVQTDAAMSAETADLLLGVCVKRSFDRISVDGQLSTNDTAILMCSGTSGVRVEAESDDERLFGLALDALLRMLAVLLVRDGEGSLRIGRVVVRGADQPAVERCARAVANSPLVKTALHGADPNWGRIAQSVGMAMAHAAPLALDIDIEGIAVCRDGAAVAYDAAALDAAAVGDEIEYEVALGRSDANGAEAEVFFSDLGHEYVTINAEYTT
ncbi:MAG TPA: bifunctional glutamate N-acetyltransferase/amino-acid acetyltransferase ArgJ [Solirubrobacteraceae bacterium]|nr:bifunctional glutamate N-acetyltransferase/amino-acid acetyltransferase ArgJ [Solirubrobacteraceae bacterium]